VVDEDEIVANCVLLLFAGHETTAILIANGLTLLMAHPDQLALLKSRPELTASAVEEMLRCEGPVVMVARESTEPVTVAGQDFGAGEFFYLAVYAGNHDPAVFPDPARFDITRAHNRHVGFGIGTYYCLGAALARVEADECFRLLLERLPGIRPAANEDPQWTYVPPMGGKRFDTLPVEF
jgi:cytochrome P450